MTFQTGEMVQLKSGGPAMTVVRQTASGELVCKWFDAKFHEDIFPAAALIAVSEDDSGPIII